MFPLLASKPQSFKIPLIQREKCLQTGIKLSAISIQINEPKITAILVIHDTQILILNPESLDIIQEIILDFPVKAFQFKDSILSLSLDISIPSGGDDICTFTGKDCSFSIDISPNEAFFKFSLNPIAFTVEKCPEDPHFHPPPEKVLEVIEGDLLAKLNQTNHLEITLKNNRSEILSSVRCAFETDFEPEALIWIEKDLFILSFASNPIDTLRILKFNLIQSAPPTNGFNLPLIAWNRDLIHVHRSNGISPSWFTLQGSEVWDVLYSPVGNVKDIQVSSDGSCLIISGVEGIALCDFIKRSWENLPFPSLNHIRWIGDSHIIALTPNQPCLIIISREAKDEVFMILVEDAQSINFMDTFNNWQILIQKSDLMEIYKFDPETLRSTLFKTFVIDPQPLRQAACLQDALFLLFENGKLVMIEDGLGKESLIEEGVESFVVLPTGHFLIKKININQSVVWKRDHPPQILDSNPLAVLPFTNCMTLLSLNTDCRNFSLSSPIQSKFLLPNLFEGDPEIIDKWIEDPLFPTAMEFILLAGLKNPDIFKVLKVHTSDDPRLQAIVSRSVASISRKIEIDEAINSLFVHFSSITVLSHLRIDETINFLPFLAKAFDITGKDEFLDTIKRALNELFSKRKNYPLITRIQEYFEAFNRSGDLFKECLREKVQSLWTSGRVFKALELIQETGIEVEAEKYLFINNDDQVFLKCMALDEMISPIDSNTFHSWLKAHNS